MNLLKETLGQLVEEGKTPDDVLWVGNKDHWFSWAEFAALADQEYDSGYGSPEVATDLLVVGENFWLERHEYDGSEWWEFKDLPKKPKTHKVPNKLIGDLWPKLNEMNKWESS